MLDSKRRAIIFFILALLFAALAGIMFLQKLQELNDGLGEMEEVYVAATEIHSRAILTPDLLRAEEIPKRYVTDSHIVDPEQVVDKMLMVPVNAEDLITKEMLKDVDLLREEENRLVRILQGGNVQFEEELTFQDRIDIVVTREVNGKLETELFMEDVPVAATQGTGEDFQGVYVEVPMGEAIELIDTELTAYHIRVLKANAGMHQPVTPTEETNDEEQAEQEQSEENIEEVEKKEDEAEKQDDESKDEEKSGE